MGGAHSASCNDIAFEIWQHAIYNNVWVSAAHIPGIHNDTAVRKSSDVTEWKLYENVFRYISDRYGTPSIDLFASYQNAQLDRYASWHPDPGSVAIDAFTIPWGNEFAYLHSPFQPHLAGTEEDMQRTGDSSPDNAIMADPIVVPNHSQNANRRPNDRTEQAPSPARDTGNASSLSEVETSCSENLGDCSMSEGFRWRVSDSFRQQKDNAHATSTKESLRNGQAFMVKGTLIHLEHL